MMAEGAAARLRAWYLVLTKPRQEMTARTQLERQGYEVLLPLVRVRQRLQRRERVRVEPLFPRYLFVQLRPQSDNFAPIRSTVGVCGLVRFGQDYARAPVHLMQELQKNVDAEGVRELPSPPLQTGDRVRLLDGALAGYEAIFTAAKGKDRVALLLEIAGRHLTIETRADAIVAVD